MKTIFGSFTFKTIHFDCVFTYVKHFNSTYGIRWSVSIACLQCWWLLMEKMSALSSSSPSPLCFPPFFRFGKTKFACTPNAFLSQSQSVCINFAFFKCLQVKCLTFPAQKYRTVINIHLICLHIHAKRNRRSFSIALKLGSQKGFLSNVVSIRIELIKF